MMIGLVTDSPADLPADWVERYGILVIPAVVVIEGRGYVDGLEISREEFYNRLPAMRTPPKTAAPSPEDYAVRYRQLLGAGCEHIISLHTAEKLTAMANIARQAAVEFEGAVTVLESGSLSLGTGFQVMAAAEALEQGLGLDATLEAILFTRQRICVGAALDTMDYLRRSGRVPAAVTALGGVLNIRPVVEVVDGAVKPVTAARTTGRATEALYKFLTEKGPLERLAILHTNAETRAREFLGMLMDGDMRRDIPREVRIVNVTSLIGTHVGPNGLGFAGVRKG